MGSAILIVTATLLTGVGGLGLLWLWLRGRRLSVAGAGGTAPRSAEVFEFACTECKRQLVIARSTLRPLIAAEMALMVREKPELVRRPLGEASCPHCGAAHCFDTGGRLPRHVATDRMALHERGNRCMECGRHLHAPAFAPGSHDGNLREAPLLADNGVSCQFCHAIVCYECCEKTTMNRAKGGALRCPRCFRHPVEHVYHGG